MLEYLVLILWFGLAVANFLIARRLYGLAKQLNQLTEEMTRRSEAQKAPPFEPKR